MTLTFQPYQITEDEFGDGIEVRIWALTPNLVDNVTRPCLVRVQNCVKIFYLEIPGEYFRFGKAFVMHQNDEVFEILRSEISNKFDEIVDVEFCYKKKLNEFENDKLYPMLRVSVKKLDFVNRNKRRFEEFGIKSDFFDGNVRYTVIEGKITVINRAMIDYDFNYTSWMQIPSSVLIDDRLKISTVEEYLVDSFGELTFPAESSTQGLHTAPKILSYDLETYSPKDNVFTVPENPACVVYMCSFAMKERDGTVKKILLMIGPLLNDDGTEYQPEDFEMIYVPDEVSFLEKWIEIIEELDPEVITGYNIFKFDNNYIKKRADLLTVTLQDPSRLRTRGELKFKTMESDTRAYGKQILVYTEKVEGRIMLDVLPFVEKQYRLPQYKLDVVAKHFLGDQKDDVSAAEMFRAYRLQHGIDQRVELPVIDHKPMVNVAKYCMKDSDLVIRLFDKFNLWNATIETSKVVDVGCQELYIRGQQIRCYNVLHKGAHACNFVMQNRVDPPDYYVQGAFVCPPTPGLYQNVHVWDFASLYPSIIIANNICFSTLVLDDSVPDSMCNIIDTIQMEPIDEVKKKEDVFGKDDQGILADPTKDEDEDSPKVAKGGKIEVRYRIRFLKKEYKEGILPSIVSGLVDERRRVRSLIKNSGSEVEKAILDARQLALKVVCNSCYGFTGIRKNARYACLEIAIAVTGWGREYIGKSMDVIRNDFRDLGSQVVYGDTDSTFANFLSSTKLNWEYIRKEVAARVEALLPRPLEFEFEKTFSAILLFKKKNYAGYRYDAKDNIILEKNGQPKLFSSGIEIVRRDKFNFLKEIQEKIIRITLAATPHADILCLNYLQKKVIDLLEGNIDPSDLTIVRKMGAGYKNDSAPMKILADKLARVGKPAQPGEQLKLLVLEATPETGDKVSERTILYEDFDPNVDRVDVEHYIKGLMQPVDKVFHTAYSKKYSNIFPFEPVNSRFKKVSLSTPMELMHQIIRDAKKKSNWKSNAIDKILDLGKAF